MSFSLHAYNKVPLWKSPHVREFVQPFPIIENNYHVEAEQYNEGIKKILLDGIDVQSKLTNVKALGSNFEPQIFGGGPLSWTGGDEGRSQDSNTKRPALRRPRPAAAEGSLAPRRTQKTRKPTTPARCNHLRSLGRFFGVPRAARLESPAAASSGGTSRTDSREDQPVPG